MKSIFQYSVFFLIFLLLPQIAGAQAIRADHTTVDPTLIPDAALSSASALRVVVRRASVGGNIDDGLNALQTENSKYNRSNWVFSFLGNPGWQEKVDDFINYTAAHTSEYDVFSMKFCWIDPTASFTSYRDALLQLESTYPSKRFVWWTMPITRDPDGSQSLRQAFNNSVRNFAAANGKLLFDITDIEAYNAAGDNKKTDGSGNELQQDVWSLDGGHLNATGSIRVASAWWWLMAQVAMPLPVQTTSFTISVQGMSAELRWSTATEINNYGFDVERRKIAVEWVGTNSWEKIGFVSGFGTSNSPHEYSYSDSRLHAGRYMYRLKQIDNDAAFEYSLSAEVEVGAMPHEFTVSQNYPNPFNPTTIIEFSLAEKSKVLLKVYNVLGQEVATLLDGEMQAGILHRVPFDASRLSSGIYFYRLEAKGNVQVKKLVLMK
jgi:hypothetical protein